MNRVLVGNIRTLLQKREAELRAGGWQQLWINAVTRFAGSVTFVYLHLSRRSC